MKKILLAAILILIFNTYGYPDFHIKQKIHTDSYYYGGVTRPEVNRSAEICIGKKKFKLETKNRITILDYDKGFCCILNKNTKTYVRTPLPLNLVKIVPDDLAKMLASTQYKGSVKKTGKKKTFDKYKSDEYNVNSYVIYNDNKVNETDSIYWLTTNVPINLNEYQIFQKDLYRLRNFGETLVNELAGMKGFPIYAESFFYPKGFSVKTTSKVVEINEKNFPSTFYSVPEGYKQKEKLSMQDIRNR